MSPQLARRRCLLCHRADNFPPHAGSRAKTSKAFLFLFLGLCCWPQFACRSRSANVNVNVKDELQRYMHEAKHWGVTEKKIINAVEAVRRDQFVHDELVIETLKPIINVSRDYVYKLEQYHPHSPSLMNVHQEYIEAWRAYYLAIVAIVDAVAKKDYVQLAKTKDDLLEAQHSVASALADLAHLLREAGLRQESSQKEFLPSAEDH